MSKEQSRANICGGEKRCPLAVFQSRMRDDYAQCVADGCVTEAEAAWQSLEFSHPTFDSDWFATSRDRRRFFDKDTIGDWIKCGLVQTTKLSPQ